MKNKFININIKEFLKINKINKKGKSNILLKQILKSRIPINNLREIIYFYENNNHIFKKKYEIKIDNTIISEKNSSLKEFKIIIKKIICMSILDNFKNEIKLIIN
jgi:hypothetical protein